MCKFIHKLHILHYAVPEQLITFYFFFGSNLVYYEQSHQVHATGSSALRGLWQSYPQVL